MIYLNVIDKKYIRQNNVVSDYIGLYAENSKEASKFIRGITNISQVTPDTRFEFYDEFEGEDGCDYIVLENSLGCFITREDNVECSCDTVLEAYGIKDIIKNGDKTILIDGIDGGKYITTRSEKDRNDIEKAVMILLLKREGYSVADIYEIISSVKNTTKKKKSTTKSSTTKVSKKKLKVVEETEIKPETV